MDEYGKDWKRPSYGDFIDWVRDQSGVICHEVDVPYEKLTDDQQSHVAWATCAVGRFCADNDVLIDEFRECLRRANFGVYELLKLSLPHTYEQLDEISTWDDSILIPLTEMPLDQRECPETLEQALQTYRDQEQLGLIDL
jgi:hypothetical protein